MRRRPRLRVVAPARPAVGVHASRSAARFAADQLEHAIAAGWNKQQRAILFDDILAGLLAARDDDGRVCLIRPGE